MSGFELQDELQAFQDIESYVIQHEHDFSVEDPRALLEAAVEAVAESPDAITDREVFDVYRSLLKSAGALPGPIMNKLLDSISSGFAAEVEATQRDIEQEDQQTFMAHKTPLEMYAFLLRWFVTVAEKSRTSEDGEPVAVAPKPRRGRGGKAGGTSRAAASRAAARDNDTWTWVDQIPTTLALISKVLRISTQRIWTTTAERDIFIQCLTWPAYNISESEQYMKIQSIKLGIYKVICLAVKHHGHTLAAQISIMQSLQYHEHLSEPMAECLTVLAKEFDFSQLGEDILREIAGKNFSAQDTKGPRNFSKFLVRFADLSPRSVLKQISLLLAHLDSESYPMRMAIVEIIGCLIRELASSDDITTDTVQTCKKVANFYDLLLDRMLDLSTYVRTKVLTVFIKLCEMPVKFPEQRLAMTRVATVALEDKAAGVRKGAILLIMKLIQTHPFGTMYGGMLGLREWEDRYHETKAQLKKSGEAAGNVIDVEHDEAEADNEEDGEAAEEGVEDAEGDATPKKKSKRTRVKTEDDMDVDDEAEQGEEDNDESETEDVDDDDNDGEADLYLDDDDGGAGKQKAMKKKTKKKKKSKKGLSRRKSELNMAALENLEGNEVLRLRLHKKYCAEALTFIRLVEGAMDVIGQLLGSTNKAEVLEAMEFFRTAYEYKLDGVAAGIKKMLHLIWSKEGNATSEDGEKLKGVRAKLLECYRSLYFDPLPGMDAKQQVNRIAKNMIELTYDATLAELTSLEEMMRSLMDDDQIHQDVITKLWQVYSSPRSLPKAQRRGAIVILGMLALARRSVVTDRVDTLLKVGLGPLGKADLTLARYTCVALQRLNGSAKKVKGSLLDKNIRLGMDNPIFRKLQDAIEHPCRSRNWFGMAEQAINTIYALGDRPDRLCNDLIKKLTIRAFTPKTQTTEEKPIKPEPDAMDEDPSEDTQETDGDVSMQEATQEPAEKKGPNDLGDAFELGKLLFVVGHVAIKHIVFLELVEREWKRQKDEKQAAEKAARAGSPREELDQVAGNAEDEIGDRIAAIREVELLYGPESLLEMYGPMLVHICRYSPFKNATLQSAATLALSKFLCVSSRFCDENHSLLFRVLETSNDPDIRSNVVIALGDIAVSFSTIIDENSNELYKGLNDDNLVVKKNTLMVLTHLILNGMVKVKGQLGEMAKCLEDPERRIADLAKLFFKELSTKDNAIYNNLPDVISHLSTGTQSVDETVFQNTMKYIFTFIEKEKQAENIVEKLCQRFRLTEDPRQWRDIAYCLSLLPFKSERSVKKLIEGLPFYQDKLHEGAVFTQFTEILAKARSNKSANKPDSELNEFEQILETHKRQGEEDQALEKRVEGKKAAAKKRATRRNARKKVQEQDDEDDE